MSTSTHFCHGNGMRKKMTKKGMNFRRAVLSNWKKCFIQEYTPVHGKYENGHPKNKWLGEGGEDLNPGVTNNL